MDFSNILQFTTEALMLCLVISLPYVVVAAIAGLTVSVFGAVTSIQDQAIAQGFKLLCVTITLAVSGTWAGSTVLNFAKRVFSAMFLNL
ncbi:MAG TPA: type III secretion system export apparatus subunit SctS [Burkholderiaceae bacterium]|nr:type III secretion system export apparatus subunit SctS [Burkholderiaceae bacterium]